jgi:hypothetical protein
MPTVRRRPPATLPSPPRYGAAGTFHDVLDALYDRFRFDAVLPVERDLAPTV